MSSLLARVKSNNGLLVCFYLWLLGSIATLHLSKKFRLARRIHGLGRKPDRLELECTFQSYTWSLGVNIQNGKAQLWFRRFQQCSNVLQVQGLIKSRSILLRIKANHYQSRRGFKGCFSLRGDRELMVRLKSNATQFEESAASFSRSFSQVFFDLTATEERSLYSQHLDPSSSLTFPLWTEFHEEK